jgi:hypothetical protein
MRALMVSIVLIMVTGLTGCSYLFYPRAGEYLERAKGPTGIDTILNLTTMLEASTKAARSPENYQAAMDDLHNQVHALNDAFCQVTKPQAETPAYAKAVTINKEIWTIFKRLWWNRNDQALREVHLDLFAKRLGELRETLKSLKG